jgi:hypothetical protein
MVVVVVVVPVMVVVVVVVVMMVVMVVMVVVPHQSFELLFRKVVHFLQIFAAGALQLVGGPAACNGFRFLDPVSD